MKPQSGILATAFLEGMAVLVIELAGARALAPYYGTSLYVWTAQITATLLFLALGYGLGGHLSRKELPLALPAVFWTAGVWLVLFPFWRAQTLSLTAELAGVAPGSFLAGAFLYGPPLLCLGAVSPLLIQRLQHGAAGGAAAGGIFLTNTLGGLAGGWLTALLLVPHLRLRLILGGTGALLAVLGSLWAWKANGAKTAAIAVPLALFLSLAATPGPKKYFTFKNQRFELLYAQPSAIGLIQVAKTDPGGSFTLLLDGIIQGGIDLKTGLTVYNFTEYQAYFSWRFHPAAKKALLLGLGPGLLAKQLHARGMTVEAAEIEPDITRVARRFFQLPDEVKVYDTDARTFINEEGEGYDLIFLDAFAGENMPWHLMTRESLTRMKARLNPGGRLVINTLTVYPGGSPGLDLLESALSEVFGNAVVFVKPNAGTSRRGTNACLVAGENLKMRDGRNYPGRALDFIAKDCLKMAAFARPARRIVNPSSDDLSDLDYSDAPLRLKYRSNTMSMLGPELLGG